MGRMKLVGKINARAELKELNECLMEDQVIDCLNLMANTVTF